jgi:PAS domain S-box-containing protein
MDMFSFRLPYKLLILSAIFFVLFAVPFLLVTYGGFNELIGLIDEHSPLLPEQASLYERYVAEFVDNLVFLSFYIFILAFIISLFMSRSFSLSLREIHQAASSLKEGRFDIRLEPTTTDELGEVITAFNNMADALRKQNDVLRRKDQYISAMVDPIWVVDNDNVVVDVNPAFSRLFGYEKEEVMGSSVFDFLDEDAEKFRAGLRDVHDIKERRTDPRASERDPCQVVLRRAGGTHRYSQGFQRRDRTS